MENRNIVKGQIGNALQSVAPDHIIAVSEDVFSEERQQYQNEVNKSLEVLTGIYSLDDDNNGATAAKTVTINGYVLTAGGAIKIKMASKNTAESNVTLNINNTGEKAFLYAGKPVSASNTWENGEVVEVYYDPSYNLNEGGFYANNIMGGNGGGGGDVNCGIFDVTEYNNGKTYANLAAAFGEIPDTAKRGGMTVCFVNSSTNKYEQWRNTKNVFSTEVSDWQGIDDTPTDNSENLITSGGVKKALDNFGSGMPHVVLTQREYDELAEKDPNTIYLIVPASSWVFGDPFPIILADSE